MEPTFINGYNPDYVPQNGFAKFLDSLIIKPMNAIDKIIQGLQLIKQYDHNPEVAASHDVFMAGPGVEDKMSEDDLAKMKELGWRISRDGGFAIYV